MYSKTDTYILFNVSGGRYLCLQAITLLPKCQAPPLSEIPHIPHKTPLTPPKYPQGIDILPSASYNTLITLTEHTYVGCVSEGTEAAL